MIRKPKPVESTFKNDTFLEQTDAYLKKRKKYEKSITEIRPHNLTYRDASNLVVRSSNLFTWAKESSARFFEEQRQDMMLSVIEEEEALSIASGGKDLRSVHTDASNEILLDNDGESGSLGPRIEFLSPREVLFETTFAANASASDAVMARLLAAWGEQFAALPEQGQRCRVADKARRILADRGVRYIKVPAGLSLNPLTTSTAASTSASAGPNRSSNRAPASVGATLRVLRLSRRTPRVFSRRRSASLRLDALPPVSRAASRNPPARATATKAVRSPISAFIVRLGAQPV